MATTYTSPSMSYGNEEIIPPWKARIVKQLEERDQICRDGYSFILNAYNSVVEKQKALSGRSIGLEAETLELRNQLRMAKSHVTAMQEKIDSGLVGMERAESAEAALSGLQSRFESIEESLQDATERKSQLEKEIKEENVLLQKTQAELHFSSKKIDDLIMIEQEQKAIINVLQGEQRALQMEVVKREQQLNQLEQDNKDLLDRWITKMNSEADTMNEATAFYEEMNRLKKEHELLTEMVKEAAERPVETDRALDALRAKGKTEDFEGGSCIIPRRAARVVTGAHEGEVTSLAISSSGTSVASGGMDKIVRIWDIFTGTMTQRLHGATQGIMCVDFPLASEEMILGGSNDNSLRLWSTNGRLKHTFTGHSGGVSSAKFSPDETQIGSGSHDRTLKLWDIRRGYGIKTFFCTSTCNDLCWWSDGSLLVSGHFDGKIRFWDPRSDDPSGEIEKKHGGQITSTTISPDSTTLLTNCRDSVVRLFDLRTYDLLKSFRANDYRNSKNWTRAVFCPSGCHIAAGGADGEIAIWNTVNGREEKILKRKESGSVVSIVWNSGKGFVSGSDKDKSLVFWE